MFPVHLFSAQMLPNSDFFIYRAHRVLCTPKGGYVFHLLFPDFMKKATFTASDNYLVSDDFDC